MARIYVFPILPQPWRDASILIEGYWGKRQKINARQVRVGDVTINGARARMSQGRKIRSLGPSF